MKAADPIGLPDALALQLFGATPTTAGPSITAQSALRVPAVSAAIELISEAAGTLPAKVFIRTADGKEADPAHPAYRLVHDEAKPWTSAADLRTQRTLTHVSMIPATPLAVSQSSGRDR